MTDSVDPLGRVEAILARHRTARRLHGGRWSPPPSELAEIARLKVVAARAALIHSAASPRPTPDTL